MNIEELEKQLKELENRLGTLSIDKVGSDVYGSQEWTEHMVNTAIKINRLKNQLKMLKEAPAMSETNTIPELKSKEIPTPNSESRPTTEARPTPEPRPTVSEPRPTLKPIEHIFGENGICIECGYKMPTQISTPNSEPRPTVNPSPYPKIHNTLQGDDIINIKTEECENTMESETPSKRL